MKMGFKDYATDNQLKAVEHHGHDILVSASAGSGKTKVLVERIKDEILNYNFSISRMLIMTFTNAAAKEMRDRLIKVLQTELDKQLAENKNPQIISHLRKELTAVNVADISTIDAFCLKFLKKYYYAIDLDPNFRVLSDETEKDVLKEDVWENVREKFYQKYEDLVSIEDKSKKQEDLIRQYDDFFRVFVTDRKDDLLTDVVYRINDFANANENPDKWLQSSIDNYKFDEETFTQTEIFKQIIKPFLIIRLKSAKKQYENYWFGIETDFIKIMREFYLEKGKGLDKINEKYDNRKEDITYVTAVIQNIIDNLSTDDLSWNDLREKYNLINKFKVKGFTKGRDYPDDEEYCDDYNKIKAISKNAKDSVSELEKYLRYSDDQLRLILTHAKEVVSLLIDLVRQFREEYLRVKLQRHVLEFSDLEYFTLKILQGDSEVQQKIRQELKSHYVEIMIDEYQDTNGVQEAIVQAIANHNVFMVGDVKQSIYRFRQADPALFMHKYQTFNRDEEINDLVNGELIVLQDNFRSVKNVADLTNLIFMQLMDQDLGEMVYDQKAFLKSKNPVYKTGFEDLKTNIMIYLAEKTQESDLELDDKISGQLTLIAKQIRDLIDNEVEIFDRDRNEKRKVRYSDIAILSSSHQDSLLINEKFKKFGIPTNIDETNNYFKKTEIQIMVSLLKVIDNPHQDIPLVAVLRSPMYNFDENELAYLRVNCPSGDFYKALTNFQGKYEYNEELKPYSNGDVDELYRKVKKFNDDLTTFRVQAKRSDIATLIWNIYTSTGFLDFVGGMPNGNQRQNNLHALYERASEYEKTSFKGLFQFIRFVERMEKQQNDLPEMKSQVNDDAVTFMTIHKSKGLEFPVVFVMNLNKQFNLQELNQNCILDDHLGIGLNIIESSKEILKRDADVDLREDDAVEVQEKTPIYAIIKDKIKRKALAEEMRKLYVALTRAEQRIYLVGAYNSFNDWEKEWDATNQNNLVLDEALRLNKNTYMNWIGKAFGRLNSLAEHTKVFEFKDDKIQFHKISAKHFNDHIPAQIIENTPNYAIELWTGEAVAQLQPENIDEVSSDPKSQSLLSQDISQTLNAEAKKILDFKDENIRLSREPAYQAVTDIKGLFNDPDNELMTELDVNTVDSQEQKQSNEFFAFNKPDFMTTKQQVSGAKIGSATHLVFQKLDLTKPIDDAAINSLLNQQVEEGSITPAVANRIDIDGIKNFYKTEIGKKLLLNNQTVKREAPFSLLLPAQRLIDNFTGETDKKVLVHGIIDCYFENLQTGEIYLLDYKTDATTPQQIKDEYQGQLNLYAMVLENITGKKVKQKYLYSVKHRKMILVK